MKKVFIEYGKGGNITYTMKNNVNHFLYIERHMFEFGVVKITVQKYPKKDNKPIVYLNRKQGEII